MMSLNESLFQSVPGAGIAARRDDHRAGKPPHGARRRRRRVARGYRGGLVAWLARHGDAAAGAGASRRNRSTGGAVWTRAAAAGPQRRRPGLRRRRGPPVASRAARLRRRPSRDISRVRRERSAAGCARASPASRSCAVPASTSARTRRGCSSRIATANGWSRSTRSGRSPTCGAALTRSEEIEADKIAEVVAVVAAQLQRRRSWAPSSPWRRHRRGQAGGEPRRARVGGRGRHADSRSTVLSAAGRGPARLHRRCAHARLRARRSARRRGRRWRIVRAGRRDGARSGDWCASFPVGSGQLTDECLPSDPPAAEEIGTGPRSGCGSRARRRPAAADGVRGRGGRQRDIAAPDRRPAARRRCVRPRPRPAGAASARPRWRAGSSWTPTGSGCSRPDC